MSRYRKIDTRTWADAKFRSLTKPGPNGQSLWFYLLTGPHTTNVPGVFVAGEAMLAEALGWDLKGFRQAFAELSSKGMAKASWEDRIVYLPKAVIYNPPENPNVVKSWRATWDELPECALKDECFRGLESFLEGLKEGFLKAFRDSCRKGTPNQEQEQEQEQDEEPMSGKPDGALFGTVPAKQSPDVERVWSRYSLLSPNSKPTPARYALIRKWLKTYSADDLIRTIDGYSKSPHHNGVNDRGTKYLTIELFLRDAKQIEQGWTYLTPGAPTGPSVPPVDTTPRPGRYVPDAPMTPEEIEKARIARETFRPKFAESF